MSQELKLTTIDFKLDELTHTYSLNGAKIPSASEILFESGLSSFRWKSGPAGSVALNRGAYVHKLLELFDEDNLGEHNGSFSGYIEQWKKVKSVFGLEGSDLKFLGIEQAILCKEHMYGTKPDRFTKNIILEIKTGGKYKEHAIQTALQEIAIKENFKLGPFRRFACYLTEINFEIVEFKNHNDFEIANAAINIWKWKNGKF